ncbi:DUF7935 family protein [Mucilaginibacter myungsuensis]|uniref:Uncharacterized protein n=1 Tax=Mucilaginibacter myungsuensis TaxID=649104 RepID=A0A929KVF3_9SPHI|nr:hypothetical protein [Mucilaginibacter myungsuensis]MBE9661180.1 hypothetical protein [Mucilaginibacter myungsuensis]MDN3597325.1 hypothetical protein [Mucilaginibacter myungsuensis]
MNTSLVAFLFEILKLTIAGIGVVWVAIYLIKPYLDKNERLQLIDLKKTISAQTLPLRLQAYERVILLIDRISPSTLLVRLNASAYTAAELHSIVISEVRNEFQHNVTQQLYLSTRAWQITRKIKDDTIALFNNVARSIPGDASGLEYGKAILAHLSNLENDPYDGAIAIIKTDLEELF